MNRGGLLHDLEQAAAPMPPTMHIVTTTFLALRGGPRSKRWPVATRAGHAEGMANRDRAAIGR